MNIPNLNLFKKINKPGARIIPEKKDYGMKFFLPENLTEDELLKMLVRLPQSAYKLPEDQGIVLDFGKRACSKRLILHMINSIVWVKNIKIFAWLSENEESLKLFKSAGLSMDEEFILESFKKAEEKKSQDFPEIQEEIIKAPETKISALKVVYNSMRSGQRIETEGDVVVWGNLNHGAEIIAGGSIIIAGRLLGVIHAGGYGREDVFVWAGCFETPQVRIANKLCYADPKSTTCWRKSVLITLEDHKPVIRENKFITHN
ncbi:MAG: hypothetical protein IJR94_00525 [Synergistaceae bacterium]|nr:hypothetical protein [Synergistaceae bacterium]